MSSPNPIPRLSWDQTSAPFGSLPLSNKPKTQENQDRIHSGMRFLVSPDVRSISSEDDTTILQIAHDRIYSVTGVGSLIWKKLNSTSNGLTPDEIIKELSSDFKKIPEEQIKRDVKQLLASFFYKALIQEQAERPKDTQAWNRAVMTVISSLAHSLTCFLIRLKLLTLAALLVLVISDFLLRLMSFSELYNLVKRWPVGELGESVDVIPKTCEAVTRAITWYPRRAMCLQRSVVTTCVIRSRGIPAELVIGCQKLPFMAHAWVEVEGEVVNDTLRVKKIHKVLDRCSVVNLKQITL